MTQELLEAVDALTNPTHTRVPQWVIRDGKEQAVVTRIEHAPLLTQLEDAIRGVMDATAGGSASSAATRSILNADALYDFVTIANHIREWCRISGATKHPHPIDGLRAWYVTQLTIIDRDDRWHVDQLRKWAGKIRSVVNPHRTMEITAPCPACEAVTWEDEDGTVYSHPVKVDYREGPDDDVLRYARGLCRACGEVWAGGHALRSLRWTIDQADEKKVHA